MPSLALGWDCSATYSFAPIFGPAQVREGPRRKGEQGQWEPQTPSRARRMEWCCWGTGSSPNGGLGQLPSAPSWASLTSLHESLAPGRPGLSPQVDS